MGLKNLGNTCYVNSVLQVGAPAFRGPDILSLVCAHPRRAPRCHAPAATTLPPPACAPRSACLPTSRSGVPCTLCVRPWRRSRLSRSCGEAAGSWRVGVGGWAAGASELLEYGARASSSSSSRRQRCMGGQFQGAWLQSCGGPAGRQCDLRARISAAAGPAASEQPGLDTCGQFNHFRRPGVCRELFLSMEHGCTDPVDPEPLAKALQLGENRPRPIDPGPGAAVLRSHASLQGRAACVLGVSDDERCSKMGKRWLTAHPCAARCAWVCPVPHCSARAVVQHPRLQTTRCSRTARSS